MALSKKPVTGMKDILPEEMKIRNYVQNVIKDTYKAFGFTQIETPCVENISNLTNKQGGENEKLIFKILKRGEKLNLETAQTDMDVVDNGLRYDLTVPLVDIIQIMPITCHHLLRLYRWGVFGELTDHREVVTVSLCSVILIFLETQVTWQKSN